MLGVLAFSANSLFVRIGQQAYHSRQCHFAPVYGPVLGRLVCPLVSQRRVRRSALGCHTLSYTVGMVLFFLGDLEPGHIAGNVVALISGAAMAGFVIAAKLASGCDPVEYVIVGNCLNFLVGLPSSVDFCEQYRLPFGPFPSGVGCVSAGDSLHILHQGAFRRCPPWRQS